MTDDFKKRIKGIQLFTSKKAKSTPKKIDNIAFNIQSQEEDRKLTEQYQNPRSNSSEKSSEINALINPPQCDLETFIPKKISEHHKTLIIDLDETLVHSYFDKPPPRSADIIFDIKIGDIPIKVFTLIRPGALQFLEKMSNLYEIVIFTASLNQYANPLLDIIDKNNFCNFRLFREHCCPFMNNNMPSFTKDLKKLGREMNNVIILDNNPNSYMLNPDNGVPIKTWLNDLNDIELYKITPYLEFLANDKIEDVREILKKVKIGRMMNYKIFDQVIKEFNNEKKKINVNLNVNVNFDVKLNVNVQQNINKDVGKLEKEIEPELKEKLKNSIKMLEEQEKKIDDSDDCNGFNKINMEMKEKQAKKENIEKEENIKENQNEKETCDNGNGTILENNNNNEKSKKFNDDENDFENIEFNKNEEGVEIPIKKGSDNNEITVETNENFNIDEKNVIILDKEYNNKENENNNNNNNNNNFFKQIDEKSKKENLETVNPVIEDDVDIIQNSIKQSQEVIIDVKPTKVLFRNPEKNNTKNFPVNSESNKVINEEELLNCIENSNKNNLEKKTFNENSKTKKKYKINLNNIITNNKNNVENIFNKFNGIIKKKEMNKYLKTYLGGTFDIRHPKLGTKKYNLKLKKEKKTPQFISNNIKNNEKKPAIFPINSIDKNNNDSTYNKNSTPKIKLSNLSKSIPKNKQNNYELTNIVEYNIKNDNKNLSLNKIVKNCKQFIGQKIELSKNHYSLMNLDSKQSVHLLKIFSSSLNNLDNNNTPDNPNRFKQILNKNTELNFNKNKNRSISEENPKKSNNNLFKFNQELRTFTNQNSNRQIATAKLNKKFPKFHKNFKTVKMYSPIQRAIYDHNNFNNKKVNNKCNSCNKKNSFNNYNNNDRINTEFNDNFNKMSKMLFNYKIYKNKNAISSKRNGQNKGSAMTLGVGMNEMSGIKNTSRFGSKYDNGFGDISDLQKFNAFMEKVEKKESRSVNKKEGLSFKEIEKLKRNNFVNQKKKYGASLNAVDRNKISKFAKPYGSFY